MVEQALDTTKKPANFKVDGFEECRPAVQPSDYLDEEKLAAEKAEIDEMHKGIGERLSVFLNGVDEAAGKKWNALSNHSINICKAIDSIDKALEKPTESGIKLGDTVLGNDTACVLGAAQDILVLENIEKQRKFIENVEKQKKLTEENDPSKKESEKFASYTKFAGLGSLFIKMGDLSVLDLYQKTDITPTQYFSCILEAGVTNNQSSHAKILSKNLNDLTNHFPNMTKRQINACAGQILGVANLTLQDFSTVIGFIDAADGTKREIVGKAKKIIERTDRLEKEIFNTILNPSSPSFPELKAAFETYFNDENPEIKLMAVEKLGLKTEERIFKGYRIAKEKAGENTENSQFYENLANYIKKRYVEEILQLPDILTDNDAVMFMNENEDNTGKTIPTLEGLNKTKLEILQKSSKSERTIDPAEIPWQGLIKPLNVLTVLNGYSPYVTEFVFHYENIEGESTEIIFTLNNKTASFDWNFLESPNDKQMLPIRDSALLSIQSVLNAIKKQTEIEYQEKLKARAIITSTSSGNNQPKKTNSEVAWTPREKETKPEAPKTANSQDSWKNQALPQKGKKPIKRHISFTPTGELAKEFDKFDPEIQDKIKKHIEKFNKDGGIRFKHLNIKLGDKPIDELKIGRYRVLLVTDESSEEGKQNFEVTEVGKRSEIYTPKHKQKYNR